MKWLLVCFVSAGLLGRAEALIVDHIGFLDNERKGYMEADFSGDGQNDYVYNIQSYGAVIRISDGPGPRISRPMDFRFHSEVLEWRDGEQIPSEAVEEREYLEHVEPLLLVGPSPVAFLHSGYRFRESMFTLIAGMYDPDRFAAGDYDGDGDLDLREKFNSDIESDYYYRNDGTGLFADRRPLTPLTDTAPTPEPSTIALMGLGLAGTALKKKFKR
jgi:hypothetical protein